jgi:nickel-dependent lactate racemase
MRIGQGSTQLELGIPAAQLVKVHRQPPAPALADVGAAIRDVLEHPHNFPPLRRALTPDDHVAILVDEGLPGPARFLTPLLEHLASAHVTPDAVTLLCTDTASHHAWLDQLPEAFHEVKVEDHDPHNRKKLSYLATTKQGRRVYLNRTAVDADLLVVLSRRHYDPLHGYGGAEGALYPALSDAETQQATLAKLSMAAPGKTAWPMRQEAAEIAWLLGAPFFVQIIEGAGDEVAHVVAGLIDSSAEGRKLLDACWHIEVSELAEVAIARVSGDPARQTFAGLACAWASASRAVKPDGKIILLTDAQPELGRGAQLLRQADTPDEALQLIKEKQPADRAAAFQWASAAGRANLYLFSRLPTDVTEELFAVPLEHPRQVQRLVGSRSCLVLEDADRTMVEVSGD